MGTWRARGDRRARCAAGASVAEVRSRATGVGRRRQRTAGNARGRLPAGDLSPDVPGHRLRVEDEPLHALRITALHRLSHRGRNAEERSNRCDVHDRAARDEAARTGREGEDRLSRSSRRIDGDGPQGSAGKEPEGFARPDVRDSQQVQQSEPGDAQASSRASSSSPNG
jgi:hypothetical protein